MRTPIAVLLAVVSLGALGLVASRQFGGLSYGSSRGDVIPAVTPCSTLPAPGYVRGVYALWDDDTPLSPALIASKGVVGILLHGAWNTIESVRGTDDWSKLDARIQEAANAGLTVALSVDTSIGLTPDWLRNEPGLHTITLRDTNKFHKTYCSASQKYPVYWDPIYVKERDAFLHAAGIHFASNSAIVAVMATPFSFLTDDWNVPHLGTTQSPVSLDCTSVNGHTYTITEISDWLAAGYSTDKMLAAGLDDLSTMAIAFPTQAIKAALQVTSDQLDGTKWALADHFATQAYDQPFGNRLYIQINTFNGQFPVTTDPSVVNATQEDSPGYALKLLSLHNPKIGVQMAAGAVNGGSDGCRLNGFVLPCDPPTVLQHIAATSLTYHPRFFEVWKGDGDDAALSSIFTNMTAQMGGQMRQGSLDTRTRDLANCR